MNFVKRMLPYWWQILLLFAGLIMQVWSILQLPDNMAVIINDGIVGGNLDTIWDQGLIMLGVTLIGGVGMVLAGFFASRVSVGFATILRDDIFKKVLSFSITEISNFSTASLITRTTNDVNQLSQMMVMVLRMSCQAPIMAIGAVVKAVNTAPGMSWIIALAVGVLLAVMVVIMVFTLPKFKLLQKLTDKLNLVARENLTGLRVVRAFNNEKEEEAKFEAANQELTKVNLFVNRIMVVMMPVVQLVLSFTMLLIIWVGAGFIDQNLVNIGDMLAFMQYAMQVMMGFMFLTIAFVIVPRAVVSWKRIQEVLLTKNTIMPTNNPQKASGNQRGVVEFDDVSFTYDGADEPVLSNISFATKPGQTTAFIGSTGSGKSTLINLIPRFYDVSDGKVLVDGVDVRDYTSKDLMRKIGYVPQKGVLFSGTVESNIAYGVNKLDKKQAVRAAKTAQSYDFINKLDGKFKAEISQGGSNVSGGQKQRLSIARAIAKDPEIYIFDDSFSALDFKTDAALRRALAKETKDASVLIVAQRIGTIKTADQIIVLDKGKMVGKGTHHDLLKTCPVYREIAESQLSEAELKAELDAAKGGRK
jgi:ATP-binding cassette subfamily B protein